ncbi:tRNA uridine-5-carboxymethylaminomethyl(34) synthesis GTPase MnmE [Desulfobulbus alkaliphilus]|uniref:tRNA uridine-5-carboxymethylaminomethyl(34) synthesis GTPase MnmE n=1 Tax=Desulfobulbus alkaliphilus TaxID=869814 RepID=UPI0019656389|nr:tRNA uridine-5-carboxymethylaminomethyl(34) synthesis GTPase MnmE [Desulfobulbus alkaliphilus]
MAAHPAIETIAAIATAPGGIGGIGIIRISGPQALTVLRAVFVPQARNADFISHKLYYGTIVDEEGAVIDEALAVYMRAPRTYTREDIVELQCHGSYLVLEEILRKVLELGVRHADPGEFTKRAFLAGRIDLTRAEAVLDLLQAQTDISARLAASQLRGALFDILEEIRQELIGILGLLEVAIDFPEDDVEIFDGALAVERVRSQVMAPLEELIAMSDQGKILREGVRVAIVGRPNVGKSSLLNGLLREERALVTALPGTTRDTIEECIAVRGIPFHLVDTAGIRVHEDPVEALGIERARQKMEAADLVLFVVDANNGVGAGDSELFQLLQDKNRLVILNKQDLVTPDQLTDLKTLFSGEEVVSISARNGQGLDALQEAMFLRVVDVRGARIREQMTCAPNARHRSVLNKTLATCRRFNAAVAEGSSVDLLAVELQLALDYLSDITGVTTSEEVLDAVFSRFCIGK